MLWPCTSAALTCQTNMDTSANMCRTLLHAFRYQRQQLVQLQQLDGKLTWCNLKELSANSSCMLMAHNPTCLPVAKTCKRLDSNSLRKQQFLFIDSPEPFRLLTCLSMGPQYTAAPPPPASKKVRLSTASVPDTLQRAMFFV